MFFHVMLRSRGETMDRAKAPRNTRTFCFMVAPLTSGKRAGFKMKCVPLAFAARFLRRGLKAGVPSLPKGKSRLDWFPGEASSPVQSFAKHGKAISLRKAILLFGHEFVGGVEQ
jgi:hypothetical protein